MRERRCGVVVQDEFGQCATHGAAYSQAHIIKGPAPVPVRQISFDQLLAEVAPLQQVQEGSGRGGQALGDGSALAQPAAGHQVAESMVSARARPIKSLTMKPLIPYAGLRG